VALAYEQGDINTILRLEGLQLTNVGSNFVGVGIVGGAGKAAGKVGRVGELANVADNVGDAATIATKLDDVVPPLKFADDDLVYGPSANSQLRELQETAGGKTLTDIPGKTGTWLEFSIQQMEDAVAKGNTIHFDLTHVKDLKGVLNGTGEYAASVTAGELRYIRNAWSRFSENVKFYIDMKEVPAPW
jgi:hypothetical protein